eukprot:TRINITY_DN11096_c0_g1_i3.p2 TRINITY_DN11096_c0_g1~~TRINITY_DN11096_c0_g1_i3.p2  ORF type:complete len:317 (-),score=100.78 TRINITY_DN11096_c0_g1_i3:83-1033(-)
MDVLEQGRRALQEMEAMAMQARPSPTTPLADAAASKRPREDPVAVADDGDAGKPERIRWRSVTLRQEKHADKKRLWVKSAPAPPNDQDKLAAAPVTPPREFPLSKLKALNESIDAVLQADSQSEPASSSGSRSWMVNNAAAAAAAEADASVQKGGEADAPDTENDQPSREEWKRHIAHNWYTDERWRPRPGQEHGRYGRRGGNRTWWFQERQRALEAGRLAEFLANVDPPPKNPKPSKDRDGKSGDFKGAGKGGDGKGVVAKDDVGKSDIGKGDVRKSGAGKAGPSKSGGGKDDVGKGGADKSGDGKDGARKGAKS